MPVSEARSLVAFVRSRGNVANDVDLQWMENDANSIITVGQKFMFSISLFLDLLSAEEGK